MKPAAAEYIEAIEDIWKNTSWLLDDRGILPSRYGILTSNTSECVTSTGCPTIDALLKTRDAEEFAALSENGNQILRQCPHHCLVSPTIFVAANGTGTMKASDLASQIIERLRVGDDDDDDTEERKDEFTEGIELTLCFLGAIDRGKVSSVELIDAPDTPRINQLIKETKNKLDPASSPITGNVYSDNAEAWAISSQSIVRKLNCMHACREEKKPRRKRTRLCSKTSNENSSYF